MLLLQRQRCSGFTALLLLAAALVVPSLTSAAPAYSTKLGDANGDDRVDIADLVILLNHLNGTPRLDNEMAVFADVNQDGVVNNLDVEMVVDAILGLRILPDLPLTRILETSPSDGEAEIAINRETTPQRLRSHCSVDASKNSNRSAPSNTPSRAIASR